MTELFNPAVQVSTQRYRSKRLTFLADQANAGQVDKVVQRVQKGEDRPVTCLSSQFSDQSRVGGSLHKLSTVDDKRLPLGTPVSESGDKGIQVTWKCPGELTEALKSCRFLQGHV